MRLRWRAPRSGEVLHTVFGARIPHTRTRDEVLADMEACTRLIEERDPPPCSLVELIARRQLAYAYEPESQDQYLSPSMWPQVSMEDYQRWGPWLWEHQPRVLGYGIPPEGSGRIAIDDCEGMATNETAWRRLRRKQLAVELGEPVLEPWEQWNVVEEHLRGGRVSGWHALAVVELPREAKHIAEVPWPKRAFWLEAHTPRPGYRLTAVDLAWMGGMPRRDVPLFDLAELRLVT